MELKLYNTRTREKQVFTPINANQVGLYSCGPTVYFHAHLGNMRAYIFADLLKRTLKLAGYDVKHVMNITDVGHLVSDGDDGDDKMEVGKKREGKNAWQIAEKYTDSFIDFCDKLNIDLPQGEYLCRATDHIQDQINLVKALEDRGLTYILDDGVYFDTSKFQSYGEMAKLDIEGLEGGKRVADAGKKAITDFALWKFSPKDQQRDMEWDAPWNPQGRKGFPGWHIECSAMSMHYLGDQFDIHTGGIDHIPVHHTNEIAQAEGATGKAPFVNFWMHNEFLQFDENTKMSKSSGKILTVDDLIDRGYDPLAFRYLMLTAHYRTPAKFSWDNIDAAQKTLERLRAKARALNSSGSPHKSALADDYINEINKALFDDLNSASALAEIHGVLANEDLSHYHKHMILHKFDEFFGLEFFKEEEQAEIPANIIELAEARKTARDNKDWAESDRLRDEIADNGYTVKDTPDGFEVTKA